MGSLLEIEMMLKVEEMINLLRSTEGKSKDGCRHT